MAWGQRGSQGVDDLVQRIRQNDTKLTSLTLLRQRKCGDEEVKQLADALSKNTVLRELSLSSHAISPAAAGLLSDMLRTNTTIRTICIGDSGFGDAGAVALSPGLGASSSLTAVDAERKGLGAAGADALGSALAHSRTITSLSLAHNPLGDAGLAKLCAYAWSPSLVRLDLRDCGVGGDGLAALAVSAGLPNLTFLSCSHNSLSGPGVAEALARLLEAATSLKDLQLDHTQLGDAAATALSESLAAGHCPRLHHLSLSNAGITDTGASQLARGLGSRADRLHSLSLEGNTGVTDAFTTSLAACPPAACPKALELSSAGLTHASLEPLSQAQGLERLSLLGCVLGDEGAEALAQRLQHAFHSLEELVVSGCSIGLRGAEALFAALTAGHGARVTSLEMGSNPVCQEDRLHELVAGLREARPGLMVHWRSGDMPGDKQ